MPSNQSLTSSSRDFVGHTPALTLVETRRLVGQIEARATALRSWAGILLTRLHNGRPAHDGTLAMLADIAAKMEAFGFDTVQVDGGDIMAVAAALERTRQGGGKPYAIVLDTIKGHGIAEAENTEMNHSMPVNDERYARWMETLQAELTALEE